MSQTRQSCAIGLGAVGALLATACGNAATTSEPSADPPAAMPVITSMADLERAFADVDAHLSANPDDPKVKQELADVRREADRLNGLVATIELEPGHSVRFYSPGRGVAVVAETHSADQSSVVTERSIAPHGLAVFYQSLRPREAVPQALIDLDEHAKQNAYIPNRSEPAAHAAVLGETGGGAPLQTVEKHATSSCSHFQSEGGCPTSGKSVDYPYCVCNWGNGGYAYASAVVSYQRLALFGGASVTAKGTVDGYVVYNDAVVTGEMRNWWMQGGSGYGNDEWCDGCGIWACPAQYNCRGTHRFDVLNASGDQFHFGGLMDYTAFD